MDILATIFTIIGTVASLLSWRFAWKESKKAEGAAKRAEEAVARIARNQEIGELGRLRGMCDNTIASINMYGPSCSESNLAGVTYASDAAMAQRFVEFASEHEALMSAPFGQLKDVLDVQLPKLAKADTPAKARLAGRKVYDAVTTFRAIVNTLMREAQSET